MATSRGLFRSAETILKLFGEVVIIYVGSLQVLDGTLSIGDFMSFLLFAAKIDRNTKDIFQLHIDIQATLVVTEKLFKIITRTPLLVSQKNRIIDDFSGLIEFHDVVYYYPSRPETKVLDKVSLSLRPGKVIGLVGKSGCGKSTIASLIMRLYDPIAGEIFIDGIPLPELDLEWFHSKASIVTQEPVLLAMTIMENIKFGVKREVSLAEIKKAAKIANAHHFIKKFPNGYNTYVGEKGVQLSCGQKQRISIACAILMDPKILILDECTSALDAKSSVVVIDALERLMVGRTVLMISHDVQMLKKTNQIFVISDGKIVDKGSHHELFQNTSSFYYSIFGQE
eukprot:CAMPEP_0174277438 /NCGR_PEP_ID=MMETSP0439-20130205/60932_1 /TAXON_ID=0 /ORGANISM="Stereomyxa ramosa, Strain Chinc5" /LENGTH=339 /DNA_ID=CAMNT_0015369759 /DNA_START=744 /DNA_END=1763 /DNA_ORIENTATION=-